MYRDLACRPCAQSCEHMHLDVTWLPSQTYAFGITGCSATCIKCCPECGTAHA